MAAPSRVDADLARFDAELAGLRAKLDPGDAADKDWVKRTLAQLSHLDQAVRGWVSWPHDHGYSEEERGRFWDAFGPRWQDVDRSNTSALRALLAVHHWPAIDEFGPEADDDAWLLAQHADLDVGFQEEVLRRLEGLLASGRTRPGNYAYLFDRVAVARGRLQRYGTQGRCVGPGRWEPDPMEEPERVDERRAAVGLGTLAENKKRLDEVCRGAD